MVKGEQEMWGIEKELRCFIYMFLLPTTNAIIKKRKASQLTVAYEGF